MAELFDKYVCTNCQEDIQGIRVHCAECVDFELCLQCFAAGAEIGAHRNDHNYQFMDTGILSIFRGKGGWSAREELHLLNAIEQFGFGNWEDISKHIETRSPEEAKEEYVNHFLLGTIGRHTWQPTAETMRPHLTDHTVAEDSGPLSQLVTQRLPPIDVLPEEAAQLGYMPNRDDFEREYDTAAEQLVSSLSLSVDDEDTDIVLKLAQVDIYTRRLRERARRKRLVRDYQLVANFFRGNLRRTRYSREQREMRDRFRVFAQFYSAHEFERLLSSLDREKALRIRLSELHRYRWNGLTSMDECVHFEQHAAVAPHRNTGPYGHGRTDNRQTIERQQALSSHLQQTKRGESAVVANSNSTVQKFMHPIGDQGSSDASLPNRNSLDSCRGAAVPGSGNRQNQQQQQQQAGMGAATPSEPTLSTQPGGNLLSTNELKLCATLNLPPTRYITLKTVLLSGARNAIDTKVTPLENCVREYLMKAGWLSNGGQ
ncbi:transcriptional adapter 2B isoform X2 [Lutzomyia longipalpis]|uniref:transcriptional adapter 2B isoform X2 n=1 Tax=Lutzomyia longipalpis TaxID=7200 RepID=UPI002483DC2C|nr:transcriptional adapter 2B isoform X2 [Lutzomyia longipalpis]